MLLKRVIETSNLPNIKRLRDKTGKLDLTGNLEIAGYTDIPGLHGDSIKEYGAWFIGPRAENIDLLRDMIEKGINHIQDYREGYLQDDPTVITDDVRQSEEFQETKREIYRRLDELLAYYNKFSTPFFSLRYQGHMLWDNTLPAIAGYFATMLHNPNNVTIQASTATTLLEMVVMQDLRAMVGWVDDEEDEIRSWSHIAADGSIANIESVWAARETKYLPFAIRQALSVRPELAGAKDIEIDVFDNNELNSIPLIKATNWQLFNIPRNDILDLPRRIAEMTGKSESEVWEILVPLCPNAQGMTAMAGYLEGLGGPPVVLTPSTRHYSWPKATATLGFGTEGAKTVMVDRDGRMDMENLRRVLDEMLAKKQPVLMTVAVLGSTEESSIDPIDEIVSIRDEFRKQGLEFDIHVDAAWGGYQISGVRKDYDMQNPVEYFRDALADDIFDTTQSNLPVSAYTAKQLTHVREADSITIDPHKSGYIQYPAGSILYRNRKVTNLVTFTGAYIGPADSTSVGMFGLEGSRPGAAAGAVYFSHRCIRPSLSGYGRITHNAWFNARMFYAQILCMDEVNDSFEPVPLSLLPAERKGDNQELIRGQKGYIREHILGKSREDIANDPEAMNLFRELGPDMNIVNYGFKPSGNGNWTAETYNKLIDDIYKAFHVNYQGTGKVNDIHEYPFLLSMTTFDRGEYGDAFVDTFAARLGIPGKPNKLNCLRSVVMDPYLSEVEVANHYFSLIIDVLRNKVRELIKP